MIDHTRSFNGGMMMYKYCAEVGQLKYQAFGFGTLTFSTVYMDTDCLF